MSDWSISKRINVLAGALLGALLVVAALSIGSALRLIGVTNGINDASTDILVIVRTQEDALEARRYDLAFRFDRSEETAALTLSNLDEIGDFEDEIARLVAQKPEEQATIRTITADVAAYRQLFERSLVLDAEGDAAVAEAREVETEFSAKVDSLVSLSRASGQYNVLAEAADGQAAALLAKVAFERFLVGNDPADFTELEARTEASAAAFDRLVAGNTGGLASTAAQARDALENFAAAASTARDAILARNAEREEMDDLSADILERLNAALDVEVEAKAALTESGLGVLRATITLLAVASFAAVAASLAFAVVSSRRVRTAIESSVAEMQELANGNLDIEISGTDKDHELGQMAKALEVFRTNAVAAKRAEAQQAEQERAARLREEEQARGLAAAEEESRRQAAEARARMVAELRDSLGSVVDGAASGDFSRRITARFAEEEFNRMASGVNLLMANVEAGVKEVARVMAKVAAGDLTERMTGSYAGLFAELQASVNETLGTLTRVVDDIATGCEAVTKQAGQMTEQSVELARRAEQQAASLEETSAAMEEISATARSSAEGAAHANDFATKATGRVDEAGRVVASAVGAMGDIRAASTRIGEIVSVIEGIAFQTNLLALNASVEAARAGSAGKGFAVVATEVRALAQRSSTASQDIKALIDESAAQVNRGVNLVEETGTTLKEIVEGVRQMAGALGELVTAGKEQAVGVQEVTTAISQLDVITQKNAALADRSRDLAGDLKSRAEAMENLVGTFRTGAGRQSGRGTQAGAQTGRIDDDWQAA
jgi:methyl-accepting chemotaxis protein